MLARNCQVIGVGQIVKLPKVQAAYMKPEPVNFAVIVKAIEKAIVIVVAVTILISTEAVSPVRCKSQHPAPRSPPCSQKREQAHSHIPR